MALHEDRGGAIAPTLLPFRRIESRDDSELPEYTKLLGKIYDMHDGICATLVRATAPILATVAPAPLASRALYAVDQVARTVAVTTAGEPIAGYTFPGMKDVAIGELFFMLIPKPGQGRVTVIADGGAVSGAGVFLRGGAGGTVTEIGQSTIPGATPMISTAAILAAAAGDVLCPGPTVF